MNTIGRVFRKETIENLRDRRTVLSALVMGPLLGPVLRMTACGGGDGGGGAGAVARRNRSYGGPCRQWRSLYITMAHGVAVMRPLP